MQIALSYRYFFSFSWTAYGEDGANPSKEIGLQNSTGIPKKISENDAIHSH